MLSNVLSVAHDRDDVPVRERPSAPEHEREAVRDPDVARLDRVNRHRRPLGHGDVDPEVERLGGAVVADPRIVEIRADRVRPVERLQRPIVRGSRGHGAERPDLDDRQDAGGRRRCRVPTAASARESRRDSNRDEDDQVAAKPAAGVEMCCDGSHAATVERPSNGAVTARQWPANALCERFRAC
jgi:hypothetical protein